MTILICLFNLPPTCERGSSVFSTMTWLICERMTRASLSSIPSTERENGENVSDGCDNAYHDCHFWSFPTWPEVLSLVHTCINPCQRHQVWLKWWRRIDNPINLGPASPPRFFVPVTALTYLLIGSGTALVYKKNMETYNWRVWYGYRGINRLHRSPLIKSTFYQKLTTTEKYLRVLFILI